MESKKDTNELIYKTEYRLTDIENKLMVTTGEVDGGWGGGGKEQIKNPGLTCKGLYINA